MGCLRIAACCFLASVLAASAARADSRYTDLAVTPIKKAGEVVGARFKLIVRPALKEHKVVHLGLMPERKVLGGGFDIKLAAMDLKSGKWVHQFETQSDLKAMEPSELTFDVLYKDAPHLKPGDKYQLVSSWPNNGDPHATSGAHVFGLNWTSWGEPEVELPK